MNTPLVSILVPCYNVAPYVQECIDSIINQTYHNLQIIMIDDGSQDQTWEILQSNAGKDPRIQVYTQQNQGVASTRNNLLDRAKGDYILFVDGDDWIELDMVAFLVKIIEDEKADSIFCSMVINDSTVGKIYNQETLDNRSIIIRFLNHNGIRGTLWNKMFKREITQNIRFNTTISYGEDALFCWQYLLKTRRIINTDKQLYHYRVNPGSISHQKFGSKKLTGYKVWEQIAKDSMTYYPEYSHMARATWGKESYYLLMQAGAGGYRKDAEIKKLQKCVRTNFADMIKTGRLKGKEYLNAQFVKNWYGFAKLYYQLHHLKTKSGR